MRSSPHINTHRPSWPYYTKDPEAYKKHMASYYYFLVEGWPKPFGYIHEHFVSQIPWPQSSWTIDHTTRRATLLVGANSTFESRTTLMNDTLRQAYLSGKVPAINYWKNELFPLLTGEGEHVLDMDGSGLDVFGVISHSVHLTGWVMTAEGIKIWVPRRAWSKLTYPGKLDNTVGGCLASGEDPIEGMIRECEEEICLKPEYTRSHIRSVGTCSFQMTETDRGEPGCQHQVQFLYEMELGQDVVPTIGDGEVGEIHLLSLDELQRCMANGEVKLSCDITYLAWLIRHGYITAENEPDFVEICARMQRRHYPFFVD